MWIYLFFLQHRRIAYNCINIFVNLIKFGRSTYSDIFSGRVKVKLNIRISF